MKKLLGLAILFFGVSLTIYILVKKPQPKESTELSSTNLHEALFYRQLEGDRVQCELCPNRCLLAEGQRGLCKVRENIGGKLYSLVYGQPVTIHLDPIEKKPFYHFLPEAKAYSLATAGCNLSCKYCQNWDIAQRFPEDLKSTPKTPKQVVNEALEAKAQVIAFTYNEPTVWYEYLLDIAKLAKQSGLHPVMVSSGYIALEPLKQLLPYLDAIKIDLKSFNEETYRQLIGGRLEPVLEAIKTVHEDEGTWLELVYLVVPGYTDDLEEIEATCRWIKESVGAEVPLHFSRFWPRYQLLNLPPTPEEKVKAARQTCLEVGLKYVYTGNIGDEIGSATYCPDNQQPAIRRQGYFITENLVDKQGRAPNCPSLIPGVWE